MDEATIILKERLDTLLNILLDLEFYKQNSETISNREKKYFERVCKNSQFFHTSYKVFLKLFIIEIYKLLDPSGDYSVSKLINFCETNRNKIVWDDQPGLDFFSQLKKKYQFEQEEVFKIKTLRDKFYAHTDKNRFEVIPEIDKEKLWETLDKLQKIFQQICQHYNNHYWLFNIQYKGIPELKMISNYKDFISLIQAHKKEGKESVSIQDLKKIYMNYNY